MDTQLKAEGEGHQADEEDQYSEETTHVRGRLRRLHGLRRRGRHRELRGGRHVSTPPKLPVTLLQGIQRLPCREERMWSASSAFTTVPRRPVPMLTTAR